MRRVRLNKYDRVALDETGVAKKRYAINVQPFSRKVRQTDDIVAFVIDDWADDESFGMARECLEGPAVPFFRNGSRVSDEQVFMAPYHEGQLVRAKRSPRTMQLVAEHVRVIFFRNSWAWEVEFARR